VSWIRLSLCSSLVAALVCSSVGCGLFPNRRVTAIKAQNRALTEQSKAQLAEIENLRTHTRSVQNQLELAETDLAKMEQAAGLDRRRLDNLDSERDQVQARLAGMVRGTRGWSSALSGQMSKLAQQYPNLKFDPQIGLARFETAVLFQTGDARLLPEGQKTLDEVSELLRAPEARELRLMIVGHTDDRRVAKRPTRERYPTNWHLSSARALAVAQYLQTKGVPENRMGIAGFASHQPLYPNSSAEQRGKNRRVELFITGSETPIVGWTESISSVY